MFANVFPLRRMCGIFKILATSTAGLVPGVGLTYFKYHLDNRKKPGVVTFDADLDRRNRVKEFLLDSLDTLQPARTSCYLLHNGDVLFNFRDLIHQKKD
jgi:hypothetical protein